jgi:hypothetical protein
VGFLSKEESGAIRDPPYPPFSPRIALVIFSLYSAWSFHLTTTQGGFPPLFQWEDFISTYEEGGNGIIV